MGVLQIWPGVERIYRVVIAYPSGDYETVSEHDDADSAVAAKRAGEAAQEWAASALSMVTA